ncbi:MAG: hypothetical protein JXR77_07985 [Lentisphaeria bacterium]|nr:hypothetical protein [Lentisphaeria bacterium]
MEVNRADGRLRVLLRVSVFASFVVYASASVAVTKALRLPWQVPFPRPLGVIAGALLLVAGALLYVRSLEFLGLERALGRELFRPREESRLITGGIYAHTRNPLYLAGTLLLLGCFLLSRFMPLGFLTALFLVHFLGVAKWEERELRRRFGEEYEAYRSRVPFFLPRLGGGPVQRTTSACTRHDC